MKVHWPRFYLIMLIAMLGCVSAEALEEIVRKEALIIAEATEVAEQFYNLKDGSLHNCIEKMVQRPCDTDWVSCIDHAWVVSLYVSQSCNIKHYERLELVFVIDSLSGEIISYYPEENYFQNSSYCVVDDDCRCFDKEKLECINFIHFPFLDHQVGNSDNALCQESRCIKNESKD